MSSTRANTRCTERQPAPSWSAAGERATDARSMWQRRDDVLLDEVTPTHFDATDWRS
jgi:hypothetical protein